MKEYGIQIAGSSVGGSSYTRRIMQAVRDSEGKPITVYISGGEKQVEVYKTVTSQLIELYEFVAYFKGQPEFNIKVVME